MVPTVGYVNDKPKNMALYLKCKYYYSFSRLLYIHGRKKEV
jgi:hypothetical protein